MGFWCSACCATERKCLLLSLAFGCLGLGEQGFSSDVLLLKKHGARLCLVSGSEVKAKWLVKTYTTFSEGEPRMPCTANMSYSLNSLKGGYIGDHIGDY